MVVVQWLWLIVLLLCCAAGIIVEVSADHRMVKDAAHGMALKLQRYTLQQFDILIFITCLWLLFSDRMARVR